MAASREAFEYLERRVEDLQKAKDDLQKKNEEFSTRITEIESIFKAVKVLTGLVGVTGAVIVGFLWYGITTANGASAKAETALTNATAAQESVEGLAETAVKEEAQKQVPEAVKARFAEMVSKLEISFGESKFIDYMNGTENKEQECKAPTVASGMSYGKTSHDYGLWCRPIGLSVKK
jgi:hypothetical protein